MEKRLQDIWPLYGVEHHCILSKSGDVTIGYEVTLPELFTLSDSEYEALHQVLVKAIRVLPPGTVFHKQDWFTETLYQPDFEKRGVSFLSRSSERFFNERPYLDHSCFIFLTRKPVGRKHSSSLLSNLIRPSIVPQEVIKPELLQDFLDSSGQMERILTDSDFMALRRLTEEELCSSDRIPGLIERYLTLHEGKGLPLLKDLSFKAGIRIGDALCQLYTLADAEDLPAYCGSRINYDKYSTDRTKFSVGFAAPLGQLLPCRIAKRRSKSWKQSACACNPCLPTRGRMPLPGMRLTTF
jgi:conjugation system TraG family ATPase